MFILECVILLNHIMNHFMMKMVNIITMMVMFQLHPIDVLITIPGQYVVQNPVGVGGANKFYDKNNS